VRSEEGDLAMRLLVNIVLGLLFVVVMPAPAKGDELYKFAQISCVPRLHYFSIRHISIYNIPAFGLYRDKGLEPSERSVSALEQANHFWDVERLTKRPNVCEIPARNGIDLDEGRTKTLVSVVGHYKYVFDDKTGRDLINNQTADVIVNGHNIATLSFGLENQSDVVSVEIEADGIQTNAIVCRAPSGMSSYGDAPLTGHSYQLSCQVSPLPK